MGIRLSLGAPYDRHFSDKQPVVDDQPCEPIIVGEGLGREGIGRALRPRLVFPTHQITIREGKTDFSGAVGRPASLYLGGGDYTDPLSPLAWRQVPSVDVVKDVEVVGADRVRFTLASSIRNRPDVFSYPTAGDLALVGTSLANVAGITPDFTDWVADSANNPDGSITVISPENLGDLLVQCAFESFWDIVISGSTVTALQRYPAVNNHPTGRSLAAIPTVDNPVASPRPKVLVDPFDEQTNRLVLSGSSEVRTYNAPGDGQTRYGVKDREIKLRFIDDNGLNIWAGRFLARWAALPIYLEATLRGVWPVGSQFYASFKTDTPLRQEGIYTNGDRYQVRRVQYDGTRNRSSVLALRVTEEPAYNIVLPETTVPITGANLTEQECYYATTVRVEDMLPALDAQSDNDNIDLGYRPSPIQTSDTLIEATAALPVVWRLTRTHSFHPRLATAWQWAGIVQELVGLSFPQNRY